jgi:hypothetical protein
MNTESNTDTKSEHLTNARELLSNLDGMTRSPGADPQVQATAAAAHSILVLAEQVALVRVLMAADIARNGNGQVATNA